MTYLNKLKNHKNSVISLTLGLVAIVMIVSLVLPQHYGSTTRLLIIQNQSQSVDSYLAAKAAEKIGNMFSEVVYSSSFFDKVWTAGYNIGKDWGETERERRKLWQQRIDIQMVPQTSLLEITAYSVDRNQAEQLVQAVSAIVIGQGSEYYGPTDQVQIKLIDKPITSRYPVKPNLLVNGLEALG
ncbi:MAG: hypothetical protein CO133_02500, partial [Candidatus Komeilibacteria bacterium CG_4_9_14_3_um_filter_37_5]